MPTSRTRKTAAKKAAPARRAVAKKAAPAKTADASSSESLSEKMCAEAVPRRKPAGAPQLWPFMGLPRRVKGEFFEVVGRVLERAPELENLAKGGADDAVSAGEKMRQASALYELLGDMQDALRLTADDPDAYDEWCDAAADEAFTALFMWYMERFQVGEANASSS